MAKTEAAQEPLGGFIMTNVRVVHFGLGPIGVGVAKMVVKRKGMQIVGAIDIDPNKIGRDLGDLLGGGQKLGVAVMGDAKSVLDKRKADIVVLTTASTLRKIRGQ